MPYGQVPATLGRYEIRRELGRGTMGVVYEAHDPALGRSVALKTVHALLALGPTEREGFERRFLAEARVAAGLSHPGIVVVHDVGRDEVSGTLYIALELLPGCTLSERMADGTPWPWREALRMGERLARALAVAHARGIVHRDVKPANVMLLPSGEPKLMDFGIAKVPAEQLTTPGEFFGTPSYMSPEQATGGPVDARSDLFALGAILYLMLTGRRAFDGPNVPAILARVAQRDPPRPSTLVEAPEAIDYLIARTLAKLPADRHADATSLAEDLDDVLSNQPPRHAVGWIAPPRNETALFDQDTARESPTADFRTTVRPTTDARRSPATETRSSPAPPRRRRLALGGLSLAGAAAVSGWLFRGAPIAQAPLPAPTASAPPLAAPPGAAAMPSDARPLVASTAPAPAQSKPEAPLALAPPATTPARLQIDFSHSLKSGALRVWVDQDLLVEERLQGRITKRVLLYERRRGSLREAIEVPAGERLVKVQVDSGDEHWSNQLSANFESGATRRLVGHLIGGFLEDKRVALSWGRPEPRP